MIQVQVTLRSDKGYRPVSTIIEVPSAKAFIEAKAQYQMEAVKKMCAKRYWSGKDLAKYGYNKIQSRLYDKEKIERENAERYEKIKKERGWA